MKNRLTVISLILASAMVLGACAKKEATEESEASSAPMISTAESEEPETGLVPSLAESTSASAVSSTEETTTESTTVSESTGVSADSFFQMTAGEYYMSSGVGGWYESLTVNADGSFSYTLMDSDYDVTYICNADGQLGNVTKIDDNSYQVEVTRLNLEYAPDDTWTEDFDGYQVNYQAVSAYDVELGAKLTYYVSGLPTSSLPENYVVWYQMPMAIADADMPGSFPLSGFYNVTNERAFLNFG